MGINITTKDTTASATQIRDRLETLTTTNRLDFDAIKEGSTNKILTSAEKTKIANSITETDTAGEVRDKLETLTLTDRLDFDAIKEGSTNKILTSAERTLISTALQDADITGINKTIEVSFTTFTAESTNNIPAHAKILQRILNVSGYNAEAKINVGHDVDDDLLIDETDIADYTATLEYNPLGVVNWGSSSKKLKVSISGATDGSGTITVVFSVPLN